MEFINQIKNKIEWKIINPLFSKYRRNRLINTDFTIISNNCWGGRCYEYFGMMKKSPTIGLYFFADDYVRFCSKLKYYCSLELKFIELNKSKHKNDLVKKDEANVFVGVLGDVEIIFLHYHSQNEIIEKWNRRIKRINWNNIILKFSYQNNCSDHLIMEFMKIKDYKKICFVGEEIPNVKNLFLYPKHNGKETKDETTNFDYCIDVVDLINSNLG